MRPDLEAAWKELDAAERAYPDCEHIQDCKHIVAWEASVKAAWDAYRALLTAADATPETPPEAEPVPPSLPENADGQEPLPGLETAA